MFLVVTWIGVGRVVETPVHDTLISEFTIKAAHLSQNCFDDLVQAY